jgi:hypothetical protein
VLNIQEYANYCQATEGKGCDDKRFATHTKSLGADPKKGITMANFSKLYREEKFKTHCGQVSRPSHLIPSRPAARWLRGR